MQEPKKKQRTSYKTWTRQTWSCSRSQETVTWQREEQKSTIDLTLISRKPHRAPYPMCSGGGTRAWLRPPADSDHHRHHYSSHRTTETKEFQTYGSKRAPRLRTSKSRAPPNQINNALQIENATDHLIEVINQGIAASTPWAKTLRIFEPRLHPECREAVHKHSKTT